jgi:hypothetical protein
MGHEIYYDVREREMLDFNTKAIVNEEVRKFGRNA